MRCSILMNRPLSYIVHAASWVFDRLRTFKYGLQIIRTSGFLWSVVLYYDHKSIRFLVHVCSVFSSVVYRSFYSFIPSVYNAGTNRRRIWSGLSTSCTHMDQFTHYLKKWWQILQLPKIRGVIIVKQFWLYCGILPKFLFAVWRYNENKLHWFSVKHLDLYVKMNLLVYIWTVSLLQVSHVHQWRCYNRCLDVSHGCGPWRQSCDLCNTVWTHVHSCLGSSEMFR